MDKDKKIKITTVINSLKVKTKRKKNHIILIIKR